MRNQLAACCIVLYLGLISAYSFLAVSGLPEGNDAELHIYRIAEIGYSLRAGNLYPRWAPDLYHGFGYPIFNYYSPLTYHLANWITSATPHMALAAGKLLFVLSPIVGAFGVFLLGRIYGGKGGGVLAAACYALAPYVMLTNPYLRGDLAEVAAVSILPWVLWSWEQLWRGDSRSLSLAVTFSAALLLTHNLVGLTGLALVFLLCGWRLLVSRCSLAARQAVLAGIITVAITAFFWLPFLLERYAVKLEVAGEGHYDYQQHFVPLRELAGWLPPTDWGAVSIVAPMSAGLVQLVVLALSSFTVMVASPRIWRQLGFYILASGALLWLITPSSAFVWRGIPGMQYFQFPWRFLGPFAVTSAPLIAGLVRAISKHRIPAVRRSASFIVAGLVVLLGAQGLPALYMRPWISMSFAVSPQEILAKELKGRWRGTTSTNDFVPSTVLMIPDPQQSLVQSYATSVPDRVNRHTLPEGAAVTVLPSAPWQNRYFIETPKGFVLRLYLFDFPGWQARLNGEQVDIERALPEGFITVKIPAGTHWLEVRFGDTLARVLGWGVSVVGCLALGWLLSESAISQRQIVEGIDSVLDSDAFQEEVAVRSIAIALCAITVFKIAIADRTPWFHFTSPPGTALSAEHTQVVNFGDQIELLGYGITDYSRVSARRLDVSLYWKASRPVDQTYQSFVHLVDSEGKIVTQSDHLNPAGYPTNLWPTDRYVVDKHTLSLPSTLIPGQYRLVVGLYLLETQVRLPQLGPTGAPIGDCAELRHSVTLR